MDATAQAQLTFVLTGERRREHLDAIDGLGLSPALFAGYRDLTALRYDYPIVLGGHAGNGPIANALSGLIDDALLKMPLGSDGDRIRKHALEIERAIRTLVSRGATGTLASLWDQAVQALGHDDAAFVDSEARVRAALAVDGEIVDCDATLPARLIRHAWETRHAQKTMAFRGSVDRLLAKLSDILRAEFESGPGREAGSLEASVGGGFKAAFDFDAMASVLATARPAAAPSAIRSQRIRAIIAILESQPFFAGGTDAFVFDRCSTALAAFRQRLPKLVEVARAMALAGLEVEGQFREELHDGIFERFGSDGLDPHELAIFPDYLVCMNASTLGALEHAHLVDILSSGLPIKVLLQIDDILEDPPPGAPTSVARGRQLAHMAIGVNDAFVLQSPAAALLRLQGRVQRGTSFAGPALFSVFSGAGAAMNGMPPYLVSAAALESRAFPAFTYDPSAGHEWAARFSLEGNPQVDADWPVHPLDYEDDHHQRVTRTIAFTLADFVAGDPRYAKHLARVKWDAADAAPPLLMVDADDRLHKVIVDERMTREVERCREAWHTLQELGTREKKAIGSGVESSSAPAEAAASVVDTEPIAPQPDRSADEAYIETARCSTCNECTTINNRMFAYNADRQAYIVDITAGTYAQLVEAAESCQVSVIHPGKPRDPNEPGLQELLERAQPFL